MDTSDDQSYYVTMKTIGAAEFKAKCLAILDDVDDEGIVITKRGKPVARVFPYADGLSHLKGKYRDQIEILGDIFTTGLSWDAQP